MEEEVTGSGHKLRPSSAETPLQDRFEHAYARAFHRHLAQTSEHGLHRAYELGREAVSEELGLLDLSAVHHRAVASALERLERQDAQGVLQVASDFFLQALSAFEMVQRGISEAEERAMLEKQHVAQLHQLADASIAINASTSIEGILQLVAERARSIIGAHCCIAGVQLNRERAEGVWQISHSERGARWRQVLGGAELFDLLAFLADTLRPARASAVSLAGEEPWTGLARMARGSVVRGCIVAPLLSPRERCIGLILLVDAPGGEFTEKDESILTQLTQVVSVAVDNARLYHRERRVAETLQRGLLPSKLPDIPGIALAARYVPGAAGMNVGGDWFDVVALADGRTGIAIGDVMGRGVRAASVMGQMRTAFRAYALGGESPDIVVARLNRLLPTLDPDHFSTMVYVTWDPTQTVANLVRAGHPPPLVVEPQGRTRYLERAGSLPLGVLPDAEYHLDQVRLRLGSTLVLYTDGLVEQQGELEDGLTQLERAVSGSGDLRAICDRVVDKVLPAQSVDDAALLMVRFGEK
jgi:Stage II sporulation protein E (SpoIIE)/Phosphoserine phosphatase RsbU, N-terminal domain/GAF domain